MPQITFSIWLASKTRWVQLTKVLSMSVVPRVGEWMKFENPAHGDYFAWPVTQVTYREAGDIEVWTGLLDNIDNRGYSFESELEFDEYLQSYLLAGWQCERPPGENRHFKGSK